MTKVALFVRLRAKPGKEGELEKFLAGALPAALRTHGVRHFRCVSRRKGQEGAPQRPHRRRADEARGRALVGAAQDRASRFACIEGAGLSSSLPRAGMLRVV